jgi:hypothetical protein
MRIKRYGSLFLALALALGLCGCSAAGKAGKTSLSIQPAQLTAEEEALAKLLDVSMDSYRIFDFEAGGKQKDGEGVQSVQLTLYELTDGEWTPKAQAQQAFSDVKGRIALSFGKITEGVHMTIQSEGVFESMELDKLADSGTASMSYTTSILTESAAMELDQETPLAIQIVTSKNDIQSYGVQYFDMPREYAKHGYEHVYAVTVMFSQKTVYELVDSAANPSPSPEP